MFPAQQGLGADDAVVGKPDDWLVDEEEFTAIQCHAHRSGQIMASVDLVAVGVRPLVRIGYHRSRLHRAPKHLFVVDQLGRPERASERCSALTTTIHPRAASGFTARWAPRRPRWQREAHHRSRLDPNRRSRFWSPGRQRSSAIMRKVRHVLRRRSVSAAVPGMHEPALTRRRRLRGNQSRWVTHCRRAIGYLSNRRPPASELARPAVSYGRWVQRYDFRVQ